MHFGRFSLVTKSMHYRDGPLKSTLLPCKNNVAQYDVNQLDRKLYASLPQRRRNLMISMLTT